MKTSCIITVAREFCSGGAETAHKAAQLLEIPYYDKAIIDETVKATNMSEEVVRHHDERPVSYTDLGGFQYGAMWYNDDPSLMLPVGMRIADAQFDVIRKVAEKGPGVIVGRCADYALKEHTNVIHVFIRADMEQRVERAMKLYHLLEGDARKLVRKTDKIRANYYRYYAQKDWGKVENYDLVLDTGRIGIDAAAKTIAALAECNPF